MESPPLTGNDRFESNRIFLSNGLQQGEFLIGPKVAFSSQAFKYTSEYIAKKDTSDTYVLLKVLHPMEDEQGSSEHNQEKSFLHNEHLILSLLQDQPGAIQHLGLFKHRNMFILALECVIAHDYDKQGLCKGYVNLQQHIIDKKRLKDREALGIFCDVVATVQDLHQKNIVHRDLKLGNMVYNKWTMKVKLINFSMSKHLVRETELLTDQRGSLAYVSPEILSGHPYNGKASDMWAIGVMLYTMVCGQFPFYDDNPEELFKKICIADFYIPSLPDGSVSQSFDLIKKLIVKDPSRRMTAGQSLALATQLLSAKYESTLYEIGDIDTQVVPHQKETAENLADCVVPDCTTMFRNSNLAQSCITAGININSLTMPPVRSSLQTLLYPALSSATVQTSTSVISSRSPCSLLSTSRIQRRYSHGTSRDSQMTVVTDISRSSDQLHVIHHHQMSPSYTLQRFRRNSTESEVRTRRHSAAHFRAASTGMSRQRRLSHDARDDPRDLLQSLHTVASRRRASSSASCSHGSINLASSTDKNNSSQQ